MSYIANNNNKNVFGLCADNNPIFNDKHIKYHEMYHFYEPLIRTVAIGQIGRSVGKLS